MTIKNPVFDTDVWIGKGYNFSDDDFASLALPLVVYCELVAGNISEKVKHNLDRLLIVKSKQKLLLLPTLADWTKAANLVWRMRKAEENLQTSGTALQNDAIICRSIMRWNDEDFNLNRPETRYIVTNNVNDYRLTAKYLNRQSDDIKNKKLSRLEIVSAQDYFTA